MKRLLSAFLAAVMVLSLSVIAGASQGYTIDDAVAILRYEAGLTKLSASDLVRYDVNKDGKVDINDAVLIIQIEAGIRNPDGSLIPVMNSSGNSIAENYEDIFELVNSNRERILGDRIITVITEANAADFVPTAPPGGGGGISGGGVDVPGAPASAPEAERENNANTSDDFSDTNNQVAGVQEGDIIKTDGKMIYLASIRTNNVNVINADNGEMQRVALLEKENARPVELLLYNGDLIVVWNRHIVTNINVNTGTYSYNRGYYHNETIVEVYDVNGRFNHPVSSYVQDGSYVSSRMIDSNIYLITNYEPNVYSHFTLENYSDYVPSYTVNHKEYLIAPDCIVIPANPDSIRYTIISGLDVNNNNMLVSIKASLESTDVIYSSPENIYITSRAYETVDNWYREEYTVINKFSIDKGRIEYIAATKIRGNIRNQFYMDEYKGTLRVVTQVWGRGENGWWSSLGGSLYTLDRNLRILAEIHGIGGDEEVQSVRFAEEIGYVVTFMLTDPLFSFDLSDPSNPRVLDELKIPGFSRYMHRWNDDLLLGVGVDADEQTGRRTGLKLSMFDIADNENLAERHVYIISADNNQSGWFSSIAEREHRAILVSPEKNIIAFPYTYSIYNPDSRIWSRGSVYAIFSYDKENGFTLIGEINDEENFSGFLRGLFIGDYIYAASNDKVVSADISNAEVVKVFNLER